MEIPWFAWIVIIAIITGVTLTAWREHLTNRRQLAEIQARGSAEEVVARLDRIDARLAAIERTLSEIP